MQQHLMEKNRDMSSPQPLSPLLISHTLTLTYTHLHSLTHSLPYNPLSYISLTSP